MSGRYSQVTRMYKVLMLIDGNPAGLTVGEIHERIRAEFPVDKRSVYRDIEALESCGFPVVQEEDVDDPRIVRWKVNRTVRLSKSLVLSPRELVGLYLARHALEPLRDTPFFQDLHQAFLKIEAVLGEKSLEYLRSISSGMRFEPGPRWGLGIDAEVLEAVRSACDESQLLEVVYRSVNSGDTRKRVLGPQFLYFAQGSVYLVAEDIDAGRVKVFSVPRITEARMLDEVYHGVPVKPEEFFGNSLSVFQGAAAEEITLVFSHALADFVRERRWHHSQEVVALDQGGVRMKLSLAVTPELLNWIMSFGPNVRVERPGSLVKQVQEAAAAVVALYGGKKVA